MKIFALKTRYIVGIILLVVSLFFICYYLFTSYQRKLGKNINVVGCAINFTSTHNYSSHGRYNFYKNVFIKALALATIKKKRIFKLEKNKNYECILVTTIIPVTIKLKNKELDGYFIKFKNKYIFVPKSLFLKSFNNGIICGKIKIIRDKYSGINITILE